MDEQSPTQISSGDTISLSDEPQAVELLQSTVLKLWDVVIAGAGPAGLSAALILGRACRTVLVCDRGTPRSWASKRMYAYLSRDSIEPARFRNIGRRELASYPEVELRDVEVTHARRANKGFAVTLATGRKIACRKLLFSHGEHAPVAVELDRGVGDPLLVLEHPCFALCECSLAGGKLVAGPRDRLFGAAQRRRRDSELRFARFEPETCDGDGRRLLRVPGLACCPA